MEKNIISDLNRCNIDFTDEKGSDIPSAYLKFSRLKSKYEVEYGVVDGSGKTIVPLRKMYFKKEDGVGKELGLRLFGVGGPVELD